jgi:hypothetical protein
MSLSRRYLHNIDLFKNSLLNPVLNPATTAERTAIGATLTTNDQGYVCFDITTNELYIWDGTAWITPSSNSVFLNDILVSLTAGKTVGRYVNGDTIPSAGKTAEQVITLISQEPIAPTITLTSPTIIQFNQTAISNDLNFSYTINSLAGLVSTAVLEWRRNGVGAWTTLSTSTTTPGTFTHTLTDTPFNTAPFNYRYTVTDNVGGTATATLDITPVAYATPTMTLNIVGSSITSPETNLKRERGNTQSSISGTITRNSVNALLSSYSVQFQINGAGAWTDVPGLSNISISGASATIPTTTHKPTSLGTTSVGYRIQVVDSFQTSTSTTTTISFLYLIFYGPSASAPINSTNVRALGTRIFTDGPNPYNLLTGNVERIFTSAMPDTLTITNVIDLDALNAPITANYINNPFSVEDADGNLVTYNVYTMTNAVPYSSGGTPPGNHRHQTTRA